MAEDDNNPVPLNYVAASGAVPNAWSEGCNHDRWVGGWVGGGLPTCGRVVFGVRRVVETRVPFVIRDFGFFTNWLKLVKRFYSCRKSYTRENARNASL